MKQPIRAKSYPDPVEDELGLDNAKNAGNLNGGILFAGVLGILPLAYALQWQFGAGWLGSALGAVGVASILAVNAVMLIGR